MKHILKEKGITLNASQGICGESIVLLIVLYKEFLLESDYKGLLKKSPSRSDKGKHSAKVASQKYTLVSLKSWLKHFGLVVDDLSKQLSLLLLLSEL